MGTKWEQKPQSGNKRGTKWDKVGTRIPKWEQERNKVGTKCGQESKSGNKRGTKWDQSGAKNPKVGTREELSRDKVGPRITQWEQERNKVGTKWDQESQSGNKRRTKWDQSGTKNPKVGTREELSRDKVGTRAPKWEQERNKVGPRIGVAILTIAIRKGNVGFIDNEYWNLVCCDRCADPSFNKLLQLWHIEELGNCKFYSTLDSIITISTLESLLACCLKNALQDCLRLL